MSDVDIQIGSNRRSIDEVDAGWINQQINRRRQDDQPVCVQVLINNGAVNMRLTTPACSTGGGGGGRPPNQLEQAIFDLWEKKRLNTEDFASGQVVAFLSQLRQLL